MLANSPPISPDGLWYWDGGEWRSLVSPDGNRMWTGTAWVQRPAYPLAGRQARSRRRRNLLWAGAGIGGTLGLLALLSIVVLVATTLAARVTAAAPAGIPCDAAEQLEGHYHVHLSIFNNGVPEAVAAQVGIEPTCIRWLHTHDQSGLIHVETPASQVGHTFLLGDFFEVAGEPLTASAAGPWKGNVRVWVQTSGQQAVHAWKGTPATVPLNSCDAIFLTVGSPGPPPLAYRFPQDFGCAAGGSAAVL